MPLESLLSEHPEVADREQDVIELIAAEVQLRQSQGERPNRAEYIGRFPAYANRLDTVFEPEATVASIVGGPGGKAAPPDVFATAAFDQPTVDDNGGIMATRSFASLDNGGGNPLRATASFGPEPTRADAPSGVTVAPSRCLRMFAHSIGRYQVIKRLGEGALAWSFWRSIPI